MDTVYVLNRPKSTQQPTRSYSMSTEDVAIRRATDNDLAEMIELCQRSLGWDAGGVDEAFFRWKHVDNPAGPSPSWVATAPTGEIVDSPSVHFPGSATMASISCSTPPTTRAAPAT